MTAPTVGALSTQIARVAAANARINSQTRQAAEQAKQQQQAATVAAARKGE